MGYFTPLDQAKREAAQVYEMQQRRAMQQQQIAAGMQRDQMDAANKMQSQALGGQIQGALSQQEAYQQQQKDYQHAQTQSYMQQQGAGLQEQAAQAEAGRHEQAAQSAAGRQQERDQLLAGFDQEKDWRKAGYENERDYNQAVYSAMREERAQQHQTSRDAQQHQYAMAMQQGQQEFQGQQQANQFGFGAAMAGQQNQWQNERDTRHVDLQAQLHQIQLTQTERVREDRLRNQLASVDSDQTLSPQERQFMRTQLQTGLDPLQQRMHMASLMQQDIQSNNAMATAHQQATLFNQHQDFITRPLSRQLVTIPHPVTGRPQVWHMDENSRPTLVQDQEGAAMDNHINQFTNAAHDAARRILGDPAHPLNAQMQDPTFMANWITRDAQQRLSTFTGLRNSAQPPPRPSGAGGLLGQPPPGGVGAMLAGGNQQPAPAPNNPPPANQDFNAALNNAVNAPVNPNTAWPTHEVEGLPRVEGTDRPQMPNVQQTQQIAEHLSAIFNEHPGIARAANWHGLPGQAVDAARRAAQAGRRMTPAEMQLVLNATNHFHNSVGWSSLTGGARGVRIRNSLRALRATIPGWRRVGPDEEEPKEE